MRDSVAAILGGSAASFAMDLVQDAIALAVEGERLPDDRDEEVEAIESVVRLIGAWFPSLATENSSRATARALHYLFGIGFAFAYVASVRRVPTLAAGGGLAFGTGLFLLSDRVLIPTLRLGRTWGRYSTGERFNALGSHLAYGVVLEGVRARLADGGAAR